MAQGFKKNQPPSAQKKQMAILSVLSVVLVVAVLHYVMTRTPQAANAQGGGPDMAPAGPEKLTVDAIKELMQDPTRGLLTGAAESNTALNQTPHNPFVLDERWRATLVRPEPTVISVPQVVDSGAHKEVRQIPSVNLQGVKLQGIVRNGGHRMAMVNNTIVNVGGVIGDIRIVEIQDDRLLVVPVGAPDVSPMALVLPSSLH